MVPGTHQPPPACALGGVELVRALGAAGVRPTVFAPPGHPARLSRFTREAIDPGADPVAALLEFARDAPEAPVVFYDADAVLLRLSRERGRLGDAVRVPLPDPELIEDLVDKARFQVLAERVGLRVPASQHVRPAETGPDDLTLAPPLILKAVPYRDERWDGLGEEAKVIWVPDRPALERLWPRLAAANLDLMAQAHVPGSEATVLSYHVYVNSTGTTAGEFSGRKIRTYPSSFGQSSALVTTVDSQVLREGREIVERLGLRGPAKLDFKRDPDGKLVLLEVNPRFTLWVLPGAVGGVNLAELAYADLTGAPRCAPAPARAGVRWIHPRMDRAAAREVHLHRVAWTWFALRCEVNQAVDWCDPAALWRRLAARRRRRALAG